MSKIKRQLQSLLDVAKLSGLSNADISIAKEFLTYNETGLCFEHVITQLYEFDIKIDEETYVLISDIAKGLQLSPDSYSFMRELIKYD